MRFTTPILLLLACLFSNMSCSTAQEQPARPASPGEQQTDGPQPTGQTSLAPAQGSKTTGHQSKQTNALAKETSPYLLMHAHNPVNWYAWNDETLARASKEDKPIFLSIGYSSCHWCHVMERESFLDAEIAGYLNDNFICIKVDREERPDVDEIYMNALQAIRPGGGGWPLSMFLTPEAKPFFGGTYWPARDGDRGASMGFLTIVTKVNEAFRDHRAQIDQDAEIVTQRTKDALAGLKPVSGLPIQKAWSSETVQNLLSNFDPQFGGFGFSSTNPNQPKFPEPSNLFFLVDQVQRSSDPDNPETLETKKMLVTTCDRMMMGGIHDHLGGGFHRYSVDRYWQIPHFEKMLYDNGQLATVYAEAYRLTGREDYRNVVEGILSFVDRELVAPSGGFYASLDAESEGVEGKFYRWERDEIKAALEPKEYELFASIYRLNEAPNFDDEFYAPQLNKLMSDHAAQRSMSLADLEAILVPIRKKLFEVRSKRVRPLLDHKILAAWNGLMIRGFADAGRILKHEQYTKTAAKAADFALHEMIDADGRLSRTHTDGQAKLNAYLIDYACLIDGLIALHRATGDSKWLEAADRLQQKQDELFWDTAGGYFYTSQDHEALIARSKRASDGAMPGGNSVSAANLFYLGKKLNRGAYQTKSRQTVLSASAILTRAPQAAPRMVITAQEFVE